MSDDDSPPLDQLQPSYLTFNPDGTISADFEGVFAGAVILPQRTAPNPGTSTGVVWTQDGTSGGLICEFVYGYFNAAGFGTDVLLAAAQAIAAAGGSSTTLAAGDDTGAFQSALTAAQSSRGAKATVEAGAGGQTVTVLDQDGASSFLQVVPTPIGGPQQLAVNAGNQLIGTSPSGTATAAVAHQLGRIPAAVLCSAGNPVFAAGASFASWTSSQFVITVTGPASSSVTVSWAAFG